MEKTGVRGVCRALSFPAGVLDAVIDFIPYRGDFARGIFCTAVVKTAVPAEEIINTYKDFYADAAFTHYTDKAIDNLVKGAVGQAVQNMNIMFGIDEAAGLKLKASAF